MKILNKQVPSDGLKGLRENFKSDAKSGFVVFLLALPLSLGIAQASDFPPIMGLITAIVGGMMVSLIMGSCLTIKGPAAGLIIIVAGAVAEFGKGNNLLGWRLTLGALVIAGIIQIILGILKIGKFADFFPRSTIHGMLTAIGVTIIAKQIPILLRNHSLLEKEMGPIKLLINVPNFIEKLDPKSTFIGLVSLFIMMGWTNIKNKIIRSIPSSLVVIFFAIPCELLINFEHNNVNTSYTLIKIGNLMDNLRVNVDFSGVHQTRLFIKYVIIFALVGSLESLLTVRAIDFIDPYKRKSDTDKDLIAIGLGNTVAPIFGGLPMISEAARSSSNVSNGAKTRWANFFHGLFILIFVLVTLPFLEMIPNAALAGMLISVGIKLAHPKGFINISRIGIEQLFVFIITILITLLEDSLLGIFTGIFVKMIIHLFNGVPISSFFKAPALVSLKGKNYLIQIEKSAIFSNFLGIKKKLEEIPKGFSVTIDLKNTKLVDHSVMENLHWFKEDYEQHGGRIEIVGLEDHRGLSSHPLAAQKKITKNHF